MDCNHSITTLLKDVQANNFWRTWINMLCIAVSSCSYWNGSTEIVSYFDRSDVLKVGWGQKDFQIFKLGNGCCSHTLKLTMQLNFSFSQFLWRAGESLRWRSLYNKPGDILKAQLLERLDWLSTRDISMQLQTKSTVWNVLRALQGLKLSPVTSLQYLNHFSENLKNNNNKKKKKPF